MPLISESTPAPVIAEPKKDWMHERLLRLQGERVAHSLRRHARLAIDVGSKQCVVVFGERIDQPRPEDCIAVCVAVWQRRHASPRR